MQRNPYYDKEITDFELVLLVQKGDKNAFTVIYDRYHKILYVFAYRYLKDQEMAKDAVQHVFSKFWQAHEDMRVASNLKSYLYAMIKNYVLNQIRNNNKAIEENYKLARQEFSNYEEELQEELDNKVLIENLYKTIHLLPEQKQKVCWLKLEGNFSNQEIADKLGISINTVKTHYLESVKLLKKHMEKLIILTIFITHFHF